MPGPYASVLHWNVQSAFDNASATPNEMHLSLLPAFNGFQNHVPVGEISHL